MPRHLGIEIPFPILNIALDMTKILIRIALLAATVGFIASCNTTAGIGQDIQNGGARLTNAAERNE